MDEIKLHLQVLCSWSLTKISSSLAFFNTSVKPKDKLIRQHGFECQQHTDNTQSFLFAIMQSYILHIRIVSRRKKSSLKLNLSEVEVMLLLRGKDFEEDIAVAAPFLLLLKVPIQLSFPLQ